MPGLRPWNPEPGFARLDKAASRKALLPPAAHDPGFIATMQVLLVNSGIRLVAAIAILVAGWVLASWVKRWMEVGLGHLPLDATLKPLLASLTRYALLIVTFILVLRQFGVQTTSLIALIGAAGLAIGLALQGTLSNVAAGVMLLILRPFRVGHFVEVDGRSGTVREIGLFTTIIVTRDHVYVSMPNAAIFGAVVVNYTRERLRRVTFTVPVDRANDFAAVEAAILKAVAANTLVLKEPPPSAVIDALQEYSAIMKVRAFARSNDYWQALYALRRDVSMALNADGVLLPVTRQAPVVRNEPLSALTKLSESPEPDQAVLTVPNRSSLPQPTKGPRAATAMERTTT